eukprot:777251-Pleurochrysis_carterae.AAC.1
MARTPSVPSHAPSGKTRLSAPQMYDGPLTCCRIIARSVVYPSRCVSRERSVGGELVPAGRGRRRESGRLAAWRSAEAG